MNARYSKPAIDEHLRPKLVFTAQVQAMAGTSPTTAIEHLQQANASDDDADGDNDDETTLAPDLDVPIPVGNTIQCLIPDMKLAN